MVDHASTPEEKDAEQLALERRVKELEHRLVEAETNLKAMISQQIDAVLTSENTVPLLLQQAQQALQQSNEQLEQRVAQRTTELEQANNALKRELEERKRADERFRTVWEITIDAMALSDPQGTVMMANPAYCQLYGYSPEKVVGQSFAIIYPETMREWARQAYQETFTSLTNPPIFEATIQRKNGQQRTVESRIAFITHDGQRAAMLSVIRDITERKQAEAEREEMIGEIQRQKELLERLIQYSPVGIAVLNGPEHRFILVNPAQHRLFPTIPDFIGRTVAEVWPEQVNVFQPILNRVFQTGEPYFVYDGPWQTDKGHGLEEAFYTFSYTPIYGAKGTVEGILVLSVETTEQVRARQKLEAELVERKRVEEALFDTEQRLELLMDTSPDLIWSSLPDGKADYVNKTWQEYTGLTLEEINQVGWKAVNHPEDAEQLAAGWAEAARNGKSFEAEFRYRKFDGSYHWFWGHTVPVKDEHGQVTKWVGVSRDITERKQMEQALRESEMIYRAIGETIEYGIWICDPDGRNIYASQSYLDLLGITQAQCSEFGWGNSLHPDDAERTIAAWKECVRTEGTWDIELRFLGRDGTYHPMLARGIPVRNEKGDIVFWAGINLDLSRIKQAEQARLDDQIQIELQRRLMEQSEKERQGIARDIHDGPIQTLVSTLFNLQLTKEALNNPSLQVELNQIGLNIKTAVQELRDVVHELRPPSLQRFGLSKTILMHAEDFDEKHPKLELTHELADDQGKLSDEACLTLFRIYQEALNNIVRHAEATRACVRFAFVEDTAVLEIEDNGKGIEGAPDLISQTAQGHFGMAGMKERAETIRGDLQVQSSPGKGTTVRVTVPINNQ